MDIGARCTITGMARRKTVAGAIALMTLLFAIAAFAPASRAEDGKKAPPAKRRSPTTSRGTSHGTASHGTSTQPKKKPRKSRKPAPDAPLPPSGASASAAA
jgi:hypothetical protein